MSARTILNPPLINELNGLFDGETAINVASVNIGVSPSNVVLSANAPGSLVVGGTITTSGGLTAQNGSLTLGTSPASVILTGTTGTLTVAGGITAYGATIDGTCNADAFGITNGANTVALNCNQPSVLTVGGSCVATGSVSAPYYGGGLYAVQYNTPVSVPANSSVNISIPNLTYNPIAGWLASSIYPQFTIVSQYGDLGLTAISLVKDAGGLLDITLTVYNPNPSNPQDLYSINGLLFYQ
jgi:hypothetical protein